jgi:hypothetical protein
MNELYLSADIVVVGGGASGMMAAIAAARTLKGQGRTTNPAKREPAPRSKTAGVVVLERCDRIGRKLLATGNGRCNFSNTGIDAALYHSEPWVRKIYDKVPPNHVLEIFGSMGLLARNEEGRLYPASGTAASVLDILRLEMENLQIGIHCNFEVASLQKKKSGWLLKAADGRQVLARRVIVAAGGKASPQLGSDGSGYGLMTGLGHGMRPTEAALTGLKCPTEDIKALGLKSLNGIRLQAKADWYQNAAGQGRGMVLQASETGEILFRDYGLSGIAIFQLSRWPGPGEIRLDLFPEMDREALLCKLFDLRRDLGWRYREDLLAGMLHKRVSLAILQHACVETKGKASAFSDQELRKLADVMKAWRFPIASSTGWAQAQITLGGLLVRDFDPATMESRIVPGIYTAGEILDVDGPCGGFNLHWAWVSGWLAGISSAMSLGLS